MPIGNASRFSRRSFLQFSAAATTVQLISEPILAAAARRQAVPKDAVVIDSNENPLGPCQAARDAISGIVPQGGRYSVNLTDDLVETFSQQQGLSRDSIHIFAGSTPALRFGVIAFTSPLRSFVVADPGYEGGAFAAEDAKARVVKVPLTKGYAHDVKAMLAAAPDAGLFYVCTPNNPTGTVTPHEDIEYLVKNKPKGSIVMVDEAYIHFCDAPSTLDLVKAGDDVIVLRTFSKAYGMAGLRCGLAVARPDLLEKLVDRSGWNFMPVTAVTAATASLKDSNLVSERRRINSGVRQATFEWLDRNGYSYIPSQANFFLLDARRPAKELIAAMAKQNVLIGRVWPVLPNYSRITVGTQEEMERFQSALQRVTQGVNAFLLPATKPERRRRSVDPLPS
jgi:histidinol-phosphate aminotransferase